MQYGSVPGVQQPISRVVQGTMMIGTGKQDYTNHLLDAAWEAGFNAFDTAHLYGGGDCERAFGVWLKERGLREQVVILGKGSHPGEGRNRVTPEDIAADLSDSLERMQTDFIDIYVLHRDDLSVPVGPIVEALNQHHNAGRIGAFGGSNWTHDRIREANEYAKAHGLTPFAASSPNYSLADQKEEPWAECVTLSGPQGTEAREWYAKTGMALFPWSSLASGFFSDRFHRDNLDTFPQGDYWAQLCLRCYCTEPNFQRLDRVRALARAKGATVPQIALAWVLNQPQNIFALVGCANGDELAANAAAVEIALTSQEQAYLDLQAESRE